MLAQKIGPQDHPGGREVHRAGTDPEVQPSGWACGPTIGLRVKLASRGSGRWKSSGGYRSKFGLSVDRGACARSQELKDARHGRLPQLLHFHLGSQITNIRQIKGAVNEAARVYVELARAGAGLQVPGRRRRPRHRLRRLADRFRIERQLHAAGIRQRRHLPHPERLRRSRACRIRPSSPRAAAPSRRITACWCSTCSACPDWAKTTSPPELPPDAEQPLIDLPETYRGLTAKNLLESYHDAQQALDQALNLFSLGYLPLEQRCIAENLYWAICAQDPEAGARTGLLPRRAGRHRRHALGHLLLQLLAVPEHAGQLGHQAALPDHADPPAGRAAHAPRRAGRHHLRFRRQGGRSSSTAAT